MHLQRPRGRVADHRRGLSPSSPLLFFFLIFFSFFSFPLMPGCPRPAPPYSGPVPIGNGDEALGGGDRILETTKTPIYVTDEASQGPCGLRRASWRRRRVTAGADMSPAGMADGTRGPDVDESAGRGQTMREGDNSQGVHARPRAGFPGTRGGPDEWMTAACVVDVARRRRRRR